MLILYISIATIVYFLIGFFVHGIASAVDDEYSFSFAVIVFWPISLIVGLARPAYELLNDTGINLVCSIRRRKREREARRKEKKHDL